MRDLDEKRIAEFQQGDCIIWLTLTMPYHLPASSRVAKRRGERSASTLVMYCGSAVISKRDDRRGLEVAVLRPMPLRELKGWVHTKV
jgi:hypothetical protein